MNVTQAGSYLNSISGMPPSLTMSPGALAGGGSMLAQQAPTDSFGLTGSAGGIMPGGSALPSMGGMPGLAGTGGLTGGLTGGMPGGLTGGMPGGLSGGAGGGMMGQIMQILNTLMTLLSSLMGGQGQQSGGSGSSADGGDAGGGTSPAIGSQGGGNCPGSSGGAPSPTGGGDSPSPTGGGAEPAGGGSSPTGGGSDSAGGGNSPTGGGASPAGGGSEPTGGGNSSGGGDKGSFTPTTVKGGQLQLFGGSQSGENNMEFKNTSGKDMYIYVQKNNDPGEKDKGGTVFKVAAGSKVSASAVDDKGLRFQKYDEKLTPEQKSQLDKNGVVDGITAPAKTGTLYESNYVAGKKLSYDDISPLDGANIPMSMSGNGGRDSEFTQEMIDGAPGKKSDGTLPGVAPSASPFDNNAGNPALRDYYAKVSKNPDGSRKFYYNSSDSGEADKANVSYKGEKGKVRVSVNLG